MNRVLTTAIAAGLLLGGGAFSVANANALQRTSTVGQAAANPSWPDGKMSCGLNGLSMSAKLTAQGSHLVRLVGKNNSHTSISISQVTVSRVYYSSGPRFRDLSLQLAYLDNLRRRGASRAVNPGSNITYKPSSPIPLYLRYNVTVEYVAGGKTQYCWVTARATSKSA